MDETLLEYWKTLLLKWKEGPGMLYINSLELTSTFPFTGWNARSVIRIRECEMVQPPWKTVWQTYHFHFQVHTPKIKENIHPHKDMYVHFHSKHWKQLNW
jgi:hypothetical protein